MRKIKTMKEIKINIDNIDNKINQLKEINLRISNIEKSEDLENINIKELINLKEESNLLFSNINSYLNNLITNE